MTVPVAKLAAEGIIDVAVCRRLAAQVGMLPGNEYGRRGKAHLDSRLTGYNAAARREPWIVFRDLDHDAPCAPDLAARLLPRRSSYMCLRIVVRSIESWLLSDSKAIGDIFSIQERLVPKSPESLRDAKLEMLRLLARSKSREVRDSMVRDRPGSGLEIGAEYNTRLSEFAISNWRPDVAALRAPSLARTLSRLHELSAASARLLDHR